VCVCLTARRIVVIVAAPRTSVNTVINYYEKSYALRNIRDDDDDDDFRFARAYGTYYKSFTS